MRAYVDTGKLAGVQWVLSRRGEVVHRDLYGFTDIESETPVAEDTLYRIYSMTKPITSVALMMLYEEGAFLLENPIGDRKSQRLNSSHSIATRMPSSA